MWTTSRLVFCLLSFALCVWAVAQPQRTALATLGSWKVYKVFDQGEQYLQFRRKNSPDLNYKPENRGAFLLSAKKVTLKDYKNPILVTVWQEGASSTSVHVFDPAVKNKKDVLLFSQFSRGTIRYDVKEKGLKVSYITQEAEYKVEAWEPERD